MVNVWFVTCLGIQLIDIITNIVNADDVVRISLQDCRTTYLGTDYRGTRNWTISGLTCQRWDAQSPHAHVRNDVSQFPQAAYNEENYCRNPDRSAGRATWCYTTDPKVRVEACGVPLCPDCRHGTIDADYKGYRAYTKSGILCQRWDSQYPHQHDMNDVTKYPNAVANQENFCRNPSLSADTDGPWCLTTDPDVRWETCGIRVCEECRRNALGTDYRGTKHTTMTGLTCQRWDRQTPHEHTRDNAAGFPQATHNEENYCRNPDVHSRGLWCYTTDENVRWERCDVPYCTDAVTLDTHHAVPSSVSSPVYIDSFDDLSNADYAMPDGAPPLPCDLDLNGEDPIHGARRSYWIPLVVVCVAATVVICVLVIVLVILCLKQKKSECAAMTPTTRWAGPRPLPWRPGSGRRSLDRASSSGTPRDHSVQKTGAEGNSGYEEPVNTTSFSKDACEDPYSGYEEQVKRYENTEQPQQIYEQLYD